MAENKPFVDVQAVSQVYSTGERKFTAVENINLTLGEGEFACLLGPSGCGRTLLRIITGLQAPTQGKSCTGVSSAGRVHHHRLSDVRPLPWLTVLENVSGDPSSPKLRSARAVALLDRVGLGGSTGLSSRAVGRYAPEGGLCARHGRPAGAVVPGRAVLGAGRTERRVAARRAD
jgi:NitT/TauT family transport system ATP-binding protein